MKELCLNKLEILWKFFSKFQCNFRKGYNTQQYLVALIEKYRSVTNKGKPFGVLLTDLSDCNETRTQQPLSS